MSQQDFQFLRRFLLLVAIVLMAALAVTNARAAGLLEAVAVLGLEMGDELSANGSKEAFDFALSLGLERP